MEAEHLAELLDAAVAVLDGHPTTSTTDAAVSLIVQAYSDPRRSYHNLEHLRTVLSVGDRIALQQAFLPEQHAEITVAALFHDLIYLPDRHGNEIASAQVSSAILQAASVSLDATQRIHAAIVATDPTSEATTDRVAQALVDADLSVLASTPPVYDQYVHNVRDEYAFVPDDQWRTGRAEVLCQLLSRSQLFTLLDDGDTELRARANLTRELDGLRS